MTPALQLSGVCKRFGSFTAVADLDLSLPPGEIIGFLGPNGAGKTTTLRMVMSILYPDAGEIRVLGHPRALEVKDRIGYLPEERGLYRKMTVHQTLSYFGRLKGLHGRELTERIRTHLDRVGLGSWAARKVEALSKGMQQKVQFVATILHEPELVILDEPFSGLDPINAEALKQLMFELRGRGATVIFSTHQMDAAERLCDRIVLINRGRKLLDGRVDDVRHQFESRVVAIEGAGDLRALAGLPGVVRAECTAGQARLELGPDLDPQVILRSAVDLLRITRFEVQRPSLHEIFVKLVGTDHDVFAGEDAVLAARGAD